MSVLIAARRVLRATVLPAFLFSLSAYFLWHSVNGEHGLSGELVREQLIGEAKDGLAQARAERAALERRVIGLRGPMVDGDMLEERARAALNMVRREDVVVPYEANQRLW